MDDLDRIQAAEEATMQRIDLGSAVPRDGTDETPNLEDYVCRIGCIRTENGWYGCGITSVVFGALIHRPPETVAKNDEIIEGEIINGEEK
ncbi:MAG: hypothetical protein PUC15_08315 [Lentisphaeria bacterium]|nr:hypothetical protein [Lentisphaeria bacterium]